MSAARWSWLVVLPVSLLTGCFDPSGGILDPTIDGTATSTTPGPTTTTDPGATSIEGSTTTSPGDTTEGDTLEAGTTVELDGTSTGSASGSTSEGTTTTDGGESSSSEGGESSSGGPACVPGPPEIEFESLGGFVNQGDAWQSFTADSTGDISQVDLYWNLSGTNDSFTMNIYEGEGIGGMLLHTELFPGQGMGVFVGFDVNVLSAPIPITAGSIYTVQAVDTFGWQTANGAIAGANSSLGVGQHKNIRVWVEPCR